MSVAKIRLSKKETDLVSDADWILTKNGIIRAIVEFLSAWQTEQQGSVQHSPLLIDAWQQSAPKISRGENYEGLPWIVLDYPRAFAHPGFAAIRTLFWWGRFFSITLHASGKFKEQLAPRLAASRAKLADRDFHICIQPNEWDHRFAPENYRPASGMNDTEWTERLQEKSFLKIAVHFPVESLDGLPDKLEKEFRFLVELIRA